MYDLAGYGTLLCSVWRLILHKFHRLTDLLDVDSCSILRANSTVIVSSLRIQFVIIRHLSGNARQDMRGSSALQRQT